MYDLIGDIHRHAASLKQLLKKMEYKEIDGVWQHPTRKAIFVGDYIDRGPSIRATLNIVHSMVKEGSAIALMGNHGSQCSFLLVFLRNSIIKFLQNLIKNTFYY